MISDLETLHQMAQAMDVKAFEIAWVESQMVFADVVARQATSPVGDPVWKEVETASKRLFALFSLDLHDDRILFPCWHAYKCRLLHHHRCES